MRSILRHHLSWLALAGALSGAGCAARGSAHDVDSLPTRTFVLDYSVELPAAAPDIVLWVPVPREDGVQRVEILESPAEATLSAPDFHGNRYASIAAPRAARYTWRYRVERRTDHAGATGGQASTVYLDADRLVPVDGEAARRAAEATAGQRGAGAISLALYHRVLADMTYRKEGTGWGAGSTDWACRAGYGNCTDFHALFISMARSRAIPARFTIGFSLPPSPAPAEIQGYHCWAHYWDPAAGWTPVDISEADKAPERADFYYGQLDPERLSMTCGRDLILDPPQQGAPLNFLVHAYAEQGGQPLAVRTTIRVAD